jgi:exodeoxyribonuclease-3
MKIASFNVNSIRARLDTVIEWLEKKSPDILCLQETKVEDADFPMDMFEKIRYHALFHGEKSYNGVAILTRHLVKDIKVGFDEAGTEGTRILSALVANVPVVNTYVPQGFHPLSEKFQYKLDFFDRLLAYFDENYRADKPLVWCGDFNVAPEPRDVYDPGRLSGQVGFHPDEQASLERFKNWGFVDVFRMHETSGGHYTYWDYRIRNTIKRKMGWRVDHIWATRPLAKKSKAAWIDVGPRLALKPSDHTFIVAEFDMKKKRAS